MTEFSVGYLYDLMDGRMVLSGGNQRAVPLVLNPIPAEFGELVAQHDHLGVAEVQ